MGGGVADEVYIEFIRLYNAQNYIKIFRIIKREWAWETGSGFLKLQISIL